MFSLSISDTVRSRLAAIVLALSLAALFHTDAEAQDGTASEPPETDGFREAALEPPPEVEARAWTLVDLWTGELLAGESYDVPLPMASTTKIMVALVVLESGVDLDKEVEVSPEAAYFAQQIYSNVGLAAGDVLSVEELLLATLISSGDDAVWALAEYVGDGKGETGVERFVARMNEEARELGLDSTRFTNPSGLDDRGHYSSARDLAIMTQAAFKYPVFRQMVALPYAVITTQNRSIELFNTNEILSVYPPATGVKTGTTPAAGQTLVASATSGDEKYVAVVLDAADRFVTALELLEHGFSRYDRASLVDEDERYAVRELPYRRDETVELVAARGVVGLVDAGSEVERHVEVIQELPVEAQEGTVLGSIVVFVDGRRVGESPLVAQASYDEATLLEKVWYIAAGAIDSIRGSEGGRRE